MALRKTGVELVAKGANKFVSELNKGNRALGNFQNGIDRMRTSSFGRDRFSSLIPSDLLDRVRSLTSLFGGLRQQTDYLKTSTAGVNSVYNILNAQLSTQTPQLFNNAKAFMSMNANLNNLGKTANSTGSIWSALDTQMQGNVQSTTQLGSVWGQLNAQMGASAGQAAALAGRLNVLAFAATALVGTFFALGQRGKAMTGIIEGFDVLARHAGTTANVLRQDLRDAARGTISDMALMRRANIALAGTQPEVAKALGDGGLTGLLEIARSQARATGQSVDYLYESLLLGVKRTSPRLIDNTGLVIGQTEAYERFAAKIGKAKDELTEVDKQLAILELTLERGQGAVESYGKAALTAAERQQRIQASIANVLDRFSLAVQPLYTLLLQFAEVVLDVVVKSLEPLITIVYELANAIAKPLSQALDGFSGIARAFAPIAAQMHRWLVLIVGAIRYFGQAWQWLVTEVGKILGEFSNILNKYLIEPLAKVLDPATMFKAAGYAFGALGEGILWAFNYIIAPAVIAIAQFIADFLMGHSPPPKGPLSDIDEGGARMMAAWLEGMLGVSLTPVEQMAATVNNIMGSIGNMTHEQVESRISRLDELLEPFIANLEVAKAKMEAITEPLKTVQDILERKLDKALSKFFKGEITAEAVREIDKQMEGLEERIYAAEEITDQAEVQLALAKSQQAYERALLEIQLRRTKAAEEEKAAKATGGKTAAGGAADELTDYSDLGATFPSLAGLDPVGDYLSGISDTEVSSLFAEMGQAFQEGIDMTGFNKQLDTAKGRTSELSSVFDRFKAKPDFLANIQKPFQDVFGDGPDSISGLVSGAADRIGGALQKISGALGLDGIKVGSQVIDGLRIALELLVAAVIIKGVASLAIALASFAASLVLTSVTSIAATAAAIIGMSAATVVSGVQLLATAILSLVTPIALAGYKVLQTTIGVMTGGGLLGAAALFGLIAIAVIGIAERWEEFQRHVNELINDIRSGDLIGTLGDIVNVIVDIPMGISEAILNAFGMDDAEIRERLAVYVEIGDAIKEIVGNIIKEIEKLARDIGSWFTDVGDTLKVDLYGPFRETVNDIINALLSGDVDSLSGTLNNLASSIVNWLTQNPVLTALDGSLLQPFKDTILDIWSWLKDSTKEGSLGFMLVNLPQNIVGWLTELGDTLKNSLLQPFIDKVGEVVDWLINKDHEGGLANTIYNIPNMIKDALKNLTTDLTDSLVTPFQSAASAISAINYDLNTPGGGAGFGGGQAFGGRVDPSQFYITGEHGWEFFRPNVAGRIYSHAQSMQQLRAMNNISSTAQRYQQTGQPMVIPVPVESSGGSSRTYDNRSTTNTFNVHGSQSMRLAIRQAQAFK